MILVRAQRTKATRQLAWTLRKPQLIALVRIWRPGGTTGNILPELVTHRERKLLQKFGCSQAGKVGSRNNGCATKLRYQGLIGKLIERGRRKIRKPCGSGTYKARFGWRALPIEEPGSRESIPWSSCKNCKGIPPGSSRRHPNFRLKSRQRVKALNVVSPLSPSFL